MRRRITLAICGTVAAALIIAGLGTLLLARLDARDSTRRDLARQADALAQVLEDLGQPQQPGGRITPTLARQRLQQLATTLKLEDVGFLFAGPNLEFTGETPTGINLSDLRPERLRNGETVSGVKRGKVFAAAPGFYRRALANGQTETLGGFAVVLTSHPSSVAGPAARWFLLAAIGTMLVGVLVAFRLSQRLTSPVVAARDAAQRIAAGDMAARVPEPHPGANDELSELSRSVNSMATALERSRGLERQFLLSVSHDLRTPMASIQGYAEALTDDAIDPRRAGDVILTESKRLDRLVTDLLLLSRLDARTFTFDMRTLDAAMLIESTVDAFRPRAQERGITLSTHIEAPPMLVVVDGDRCAQVMANLIENALKFAAERIDISVRPEAGWIVVAVADDGPGIAADDLPHVFERLYVARHRPTPKESGSGLGLAIVRELIEAMGGHVMARSPVATTGGGTEMLVALRPG